MYIWERDNWPRFIWEAETLLAPLSSARQKQGYLLAQLKRLGFEDSSAAKLQMVTEEALRTSEIEGEKLDREGVRSSAARRLGLEQSSSRKDRQADALVEMLLSASNSPETQLTLKDLYGWQSALFPTGYSGLKEIIVGGLRDDRHGPMQVVGGRLDKPTVHFEAPPAHRLSGELDLFLNWFNEPPTNLDGLIRAGLSHLWFVTLHPFDDGNGRVARAIADKALAQDDAATIRFYSLSSQIERERNAYYDILEQTQKGDLEVTQWLQWFLICYGRAIDRSIQVLDSVSFKSEFWRKHGNRKFNDRQMKIINRVLDGFEGVLTARKWGRIAKCSPATAQRDISVLVETGILQRNPGSGKNTSYVMPYLQNRQLSALTDDQLLARFEALSPDKIRNLPKPDQKREMDAYEEIKTLAERRGLIKREDRF